MTNILSRRLAGVALSLRMAGSSKSVRHSSAIVLLQNDLQYPIPALTKDAIRENIEHRIKAFGMCTENREILDTREFVGFGASELLSFGLQSGLIDAAVLACDGAGTVIVTKPAMAQGIGGRMSGLVKTSPHKSVMDRIEQGGGIVLDRDHATIDQVAGVALAIHGRVTGLLQSPLPSRKLQKLSAGSIRIP